MFRTHGVATSQEEARLWRSKLVPASAAERLSCLYPVAHEDGFAYLRKTRAEKPFGALTKLGLETCARLGRAARRAHGGDAVSARSTNYARTIRSARAFLDGLGAPGAAIAVRRASRDALNGYDANPDRVKRAMRAAMRADAFAAADAAVAAAKAAIVDAVPGATAESFGWLLAVDYLDTRRAHGLPTPPDYGEDLERAARAHLHWRYDAWARDPAVSALVARPLVAELRAWAADDDAAAADGAPALALHCAHDVTVLALCRALGAPPLAPGFGAKFDVVVEDGGVVARLDGAPLPGGFAATPVAEAAFLEALDAALARDGCPPS